MRTLLIALLLGAAPLTASAELRVFACEPEWAALASEIGGELVEAYSATTALQDPHYIQARPSLIAKVRRADLVICSGAQLEIGWMEASSFVVRLDATGNVDRAKGDIHPQGNPHIQTNPHNIDAVATALAARMSKIDANNSNIYDDKLKHFLIKWRESIERWEERAAPLRGKRVITHHKSWVYLERWLGLEEAANLEAVPGLPPTATHLSKLTQEFAGGGADVIIRSPYQDAKASEWLSERIGVKAIVLPLTIGGTERATDLFLLFDDIVDRLLEAVNDA
jgi:zinc/manganese transport system substrate-binding protein